MSDTTTDTPTPADVAPKPAQADDAPTAEPKVDEIDWKAEARKWEQRAKDNKAAAESASKTEAEKVAERLTAVEKRAVEAEARVLRRDVALEFSLSKDDAALLDKITDEDAMRALAERLSVESGKQSSNVVPREGNTPSTSTDPRREFLRELMGRQ